MEAGVAVSNYSFGPAPKLNNHRETGELRASLGSGYLMYGKKKKGKGGKKAPKR